MLVHNISLMYTFRYSHTQPLQSNTATVQSPPLTCPWEGVSLYVNDSRRTSSCPDIQIPWIFKNSLHFAIQHNSLDVLSTLLVYGVDPNRPGTTTLSRDEHRGSLPTSTFPGMSSAVGVGSTKERSKDVRFCLDESGGFGSNGTSGGQSSSSQACGAVDLESFAGRTKTARINRSSVRNLETANSVPPSGALKPLNLSKKTSLSYSEEFSGDYLYFLPPLFLAVSMGNEASVRLLLAYGATANLTDAQHACSPLHLSACGDFFNIPCCLALLEYGARINEPNAYGVTPAQLNCELISRQKHLVVNCLSSIAAFFAEEQLQTKQNSASKTLSRDQKSTAGFSEYRRALEARFFHRRSHRRRGDELCSTRTSKVSTRSQGTAGQLKRVPLVSVDSEKDSLIEEARERSERSESISSFRSRVSLSVLFSTVSLPQPAGAGPRARAAAEGRPEEHQMSVIHRDERNVAHLISSTASVKASISIL